MAIKGIIKMTDEDGSVIEGTAEDLAELLRLTEEGTVENDVQTKPTPEITIGKRYELTADGEYGDIKKGERVIVTKYLDISGDYRVDRDVVKNREHDFVNAEDLTEIKPKEGDIVRVTDYSNGHYVGTIGVVVGFSEGTGSAIIEASVSSGALRKYREPDVEIVALKEERCDA